LAAGCSQIKGLHAREPEKNSDVTDTRSKSGSERVEKGAGEAEIERELIRNTNSLVTHSFSLPLQPK